jgi:hypothetical protein
VGILLLALLFAANVSAQGDSTPEVAGPNLIANGDFEAQGEGKNCPFAHWAGRSGNNGQYSFSVVPGRAGNAAKIDGTKAGRGDIHNPEGFAVKAGEMLRVRFWAKTESFKGGAFANLEGEPNDNGWQKINIDSTPDWKLYECRVAVPKGAKGQLEPKITIWIYNFGTGALLLDDISACVVKPDPAGVAREELKRIQGWVASAKSQANLQQALEPVAQKLDAAIKDPKSETVLPLRREALAALSRMHGGDGSFAVGVAHSLEQVFLDEAFNGSFAPALSISLAQNEAEGAQLVVLSAGKDLQNVSVELDGALKAKSGAALMPEQVAINVIGYVNTSEGKRPYQSRKLGWWPDPLLPNAPFSIKADEAQPLLVTVTTTEKTEAGTYSGKLSIKAGAAKATLPIGVEVFPFALPAQRHFSSLSLGCGSDAIAKYYGGDPGEKIMERFVAESSRRCMPPVGLLNGWGWKTPKVPKTGEGSYDFAKLDRWLDLFKAGGVTRFPMVSVPRFRKFGGGDYTEEFKREFGAFVKAYAAHLKEKGLADRAMVYSIDEASNDPKLREWDVCKEIYKIVKAAAPEVPVIQCLNEYKGVQTLTGSADIWDLYFGQYEQAGGPERVKAGDGLFLSVCIWPSEHPNLFIEYPLLDARIMPWICYRVGATGTEYWDMIQSWSENSANKEWWKSGQGTRTAWKLAKPHGDGLLMYPGPDGTPFSSLRLESLRDGIEDYEYLVLLSARAKTDAAAAALVQEAKQKLVTGVTSYDRDPKKLLDLRARIAQALAKK